MVSIIGLVQMPCRVKCRRRVTKTEVLIHVKISHVVNDKFLHTEKFLTYWASKDAEIMLTSVEPD